jgi:ATP-dependent Clp endopeptidase proteolytic subunit ClpP|tara:strand:+ start:160 stop:789 length:630 start_codon:yes stop_codon:yes gene_type:complete
MKWPTNENEILNSEETHEPYFGDKSSDSNIEVINNHIYFYSEIKRNSILKLNKKLKELETKLLTYADSLNWEPPGIYLHINSYGGSVFAGVAAMDQILSCKIPVYTVIDGCAASAATFLSVVGTKRYINKHAHVLIHQLSSGFWGKFSAIEDEMKNLKKLMEMIRQVYLEKTAMTKSQLDKMLKRDLWLSAEEALSYGLVDEIYGGISL